MRSLSLVLVLSFFACASAPPVASQPVAVDPSIPLLARRAEMIQRLHDYRIAAVYPLDAAGYPASIFRDPAGRMCPMASLIDQSGGHAIVDWVATHDNTLRLANVHAGPLMDWITTSGLTQEEIALVQGVMSYSMPRREPRNVMVAMRAQIADKLAKVEQQLRAQTPASLPLVTARYEARHATEPTMPAVERLAFAR